MGETLQTWPHASAGSGHPSAPFSEWETSQTTAASSSADQTDSAVSATTGALREQGPFGFVQ